MSETNQNNNYEKKSIQTRGQMYRNSHATIPCAMRVSFYDDMMRIGFIPPLPEDQRGEKKLFDYNNEVITNISRKNCNLLYEQYKEILLPAMEKKQNKSVTVKVGESENHLGISTGINLGTDGECHPALILVRNIDKGTNKSNDIILYEFDKATVYEDYNPITGENGCVHEVDNEFDMFIRDLDTFRAATSKAYVHNDRVVDDAYKTMMSGILKDVAEKLGLDLSKYTYSNRNRSNSASGYGYGSIFGSEGGSSASSATPTRQINSMDEMEQYMNLPEDGLPFN